MLGAANQTPCAFPSPPSDGEPQAPDGDVLIDRQHDDRGSFEYGEIVDDVTETWEEYDAVRAAGLGVWDAYYRSRSASTQADHPAYEAGRGHRNAPPRRRRPTASSLPIVNVPMYALVNGGAS